MKFRDLFVPRWQHSNLQIRRTAVKKLAEIKLLRQIAEQDEDPGVREIALGSLKQFADYQVEATEQEHYP